MEKCSITLMLADADGKTEEKYELTPDEAFVMRALINMIHGTIPSASASWDEACKIMNMPKG